MSNVEWTVSRKRMNKILATLPEVQDALDHEVTPRAMAAGRKLAEHRHDGDAYIEVERGRVDRYVVLTDERGLGAAMSMEYGRKEGTTSSWGPMEGLWILHDAFELGHE